MSKDSNNTQNPELQEACSSCDGTGVNPNPIVHIRYSELQKLVDYADRLKPRFHFLNGAEHLGHTYKLLHARGVLADSLQGGPNDQ